MANRSNKNSPNICCNVYDEFVFKKHDTFLTFLLGYVMCQGKSVKWWRRNIHIGQNVKSIARLWPEHFLTLLMDFKPCCKNCKSCINIYFVRYVTTLKVSIFLEYVVLTLNALFVAKFWHACFYWSLKFKFYFWSSIDLSFSISDIFGLQKLAYLVDIINK